MMAPSSKQQVVQVTSTDAKDDFSHLSMMEADIPSPARGEVSLSNMRRGRGVHHLKLRLNANIRLKDMFGREPIGRVILVLTILLIIYACMRARAIPSSTQQMELPDCCHCGDYPPCFESWCRCL